MNAARLPNAVLSVVLLCLTMSPVSAQNAGAPTPTLGPPPIVDAVTRWINGQNLTVYVDSTSYPDEDIQHKLTTLEISWEGSGPGFATSGCEDLGGECDVCSPTKLAKVRT